MQSVKKTFEVLELVATLTEGGASLDYISKQLSFPKATAHRICKNLCSCGYLRHASNGHYFLTAKLVTLGYGVIQNDSFANDAISLLKDLANRTGFTVNLQRLDIEKVVLLRKEEPRNSVFHTNAHAGLASALHHAACGKVILAHFSDEAQQRYWDRFSSQLEDFKHFGTQAIHDFDDFHQENQRVKSQGWSVDGEGNESGITCIAVPLKREDDVQYAISISGLTPEIHRYGTENIVQRLLETAHILVNEYL